MAVQFRKEAGDFLALESSITSAVNAVCLYYSFVTPASQGVGMDVKDPRYFPDRQHLTHVLSICHIFPYILLGDPILTVAYSR